MSSSKISDYREKVLDPVLYDLDNPDRDLAIDLLKAMFRMQEWANEPNEQKADDYSSLADACFEAGRYLEALDAEEIAYQILPNEHQLGRLGTLYVNTGLYGEASVALEYLYHQDRRSYTAQSELGKLFLKAGMPDKALPHLKRAWDIIIQDPCFGDSLGEICKERYLDCRNNIMAESAAYAPKTRERRYFGDILYLPLLPR